MSEKTITAKFQEYMDACYPTGLPEQNKLHVKQAFMSGSMAIINIMQEMSDEYGGDAEDRINSLMSSIMKELEAYGAERGIDMGGKT